MMTDGKIRFLTDQLDLLVKKNSCFVRSLTQLCEDNPRATGLRIPIKEAVEIFGSEIIYKVFDDGGAVIISDLTEPGRTFINRRKFLRLSRDQLAQKSGVTEENIEYLETNSSKAGMDIAIKVAKVLTLDPRKIGFVVGKPENDYII